MQLIEAVPNISEARDKENLTRILGDLQSVLGSVRLLHVDSNEDANRTVLTLAGNPEQIVRVCFMLFRICQQYIDMRFHAGEHPRLGAVDVCPLVPITDITLAQTAAYADGLARRVADELHIPVYLYEANATSAERANLAVLRHGEYEGLSQKFKTLPPDYGPHHWNDAVAKTGASVIGARHFLIAFNISLNTENVLSAIDIAAKLREKNGGLCGVKAIGWYMEEYRCAQVSFNITNFHQNNLQDLFEACKKEAAARGLQVTASELIGLVPLEAILQAGKFYSPKEQKEESLIASAAEHLLLNKIRPFIPHERILEKCLQIK